MTKPASNIYSLTISFTSSCARSIYSALWIWNELGTLVSGQEGDGEKRSQESSCCTISVRSWSRHAPGRRQDKAGTQWCPSKVQFLCFKILTLENLPVHSLERVPSFQVLGLCEELASISSCCQLMGRRHVDSFVWCPDHVTCVCLAQCEKTDPH